MDDVKFEALDSMSRIDQILKFYDNENPVCPHCGESFDVSRHEWYHLYEEGEHDLTCPDCDWDFQVTTRCRYTFSTDNQERDDETKPLSASQGEDAPPTDAAGGGE